MRCDRDQRVGSDLLALQHPQGCDIECYPVGYAYAVVTRTRDADGNCVRATLYLRWLDERGTEPKAASVVHEHLRSEGCVTADDESSSPIGVSV
jgi:hypothetical protein